MNLNVDCARDILFYIEGVLDLELDEKVGSFSYPNYITEVLVYRDLQYHYKPYDIITTLYELYRENFIVADVEWNNDDIYDYRKFEIYGLSCKGCLLLNNIRKINVWFKIKRVLNICKINSLPFLLDLSKHDITEDFIGVWKKCWYEYRRLDSYNRQQKEYVV